MIVENHAKGKISWPNKDRVAVAITFDFQGGEPVRPGPNGKMNNEDYAEGEYGPKTGIWRILRMLDEVNVKTTFLTCGGIAERYPDAMKAIVERGHEVAGHGYHHEIARDLTRQEEKDCIRRTTDMLMKRTGKASDRLAHVHAKRRHRRAADGRRIRLEQQFVRRRSAVRVGKRRVAAGRAAAPAVRRRPALRTSEPSGRSSGQRVAAVEALL